jgi:hypothetical protein
MGRSMSNARNEHPRLYKVRGFCPLKTRSEPPPSQSRRSSSKMLFSSVFATVALLAAQAAAHGAVTSYEIDGVKYPG